MKKLCQLAVKITAPALIPLRFRWRHSGVDGERTWPDYERCLFVFQSSINLGSMELPLQFLFRFWMLRRHGQVFAQTSHYDD